MVRRILSGGALGAVIGAAMLVVSSGSSSAFTLSSPSLEQPVGAAGVESVYWRHWGWHGGWHGGWHRWGWGPRWGWGWRPVYRPYYFGPVRRCWWTPWGRRCRWY